MREAESKKSAEICFFALKITKNAIFQQYFALLDYNDPCPPSDRGRGEGSAGDKFRFSGTQETVEGAGANVPGSLQIF